MHVFLAVMASLVLILNAGCGSRKEGDDVAPPPAPPSPEEMTRQAVGKLQDELDSLRASGSTNALLPRIDAALQDPTLEPAYSVIYAWRIAQLVEEERLDEAKAAYLEIAASDPDKARAAFGIIPSFYDRQPDKSDLLAWLDELIGLPIVEELRPNTWSAIVGVSFGHDQGQRLVARMPTMFDSVGSEANQLSLVRQIVRETLRRKLYDLGWQVLERVPALAPDAHGIQRLVIASKADLLIAEGKLDEAEASLWETMASMPDSETSPRFRRLMTARNKRGDSAAADRTARRAITELDAASGTRDTIVSLWVEAAAKADDKPLFVDRASQAVDAKISLQRLLNAFEQGFYGIMSGGPEALRGRCADLMKRMNEIECDEEHTLARLQLLRLDSAFYRDDFEDALDIVKAGIPGRSEAWHEVLLNKVAAHLALQENRPDDAITHFRAHMETVAAWEHPERDPETGAIMVKEAVLGFNEKRIGDIYSQAGKADDAAKAYAAARAWYEKSLEEVKEDSEEHKQYQKEMALVPSP